MPTSSLSLEPQDYEQPARIQSLTEEQREDLDRVMTQMLSITNNFLAAAIKGNCTDVELQWNHDYFGNMFITGRATRKEIPCQD